MRTSVKAALLAACFALPAAPAMAVYPERSVQLIAPFSAGGAADVMARVFSKEFETRLGQPFVVVNRPGGGIAVGALATTSAAPDGYAATLAGHPSISLPVGLDGNGMPFGIQVIGPRGGDMLVLAVAAALEGLLAHDFSTARPKPDIVKLKVASPIAETDSFRAFD